MRERTTVRLRWVTEELDMGYYTRVTPAVSRLRRKRARKLAGLKREFVKSAKVKHEKPVCHNYRTDKH